LVDKVKQAPARQGLAFYLFLRVRRDFFAGGIALFGGKVYNKE
jgi:hypothetical protein